VSLFANCTRVPDETVSSVGDMPDDVIVKTVPDPGEGVGVGLGVPPLPGLGDAGLELPPHELNVAAATSATAAITSRCLMGIF
jgi:hypothetical protein